MAALLLTFVAAPVAAATFVVTANFGMTFTPSNLTIYQGDSVTFYNGGGVHNVHADNERFHCSINCVTNNSPNATAWRSTVAFPLLGTIGYYCDEHGNKTSGMPGSITVLDRVFVDGFEAETPALH